MSELVLTVRERPYTVYVTTATNAPTEVATGHSAAFIVSLDNARTIARREQIAKGHDPVVPAREPLLRGSNRAMAKAYGISAERVSDRNDDPLSRFRHRLKADLETAAAACHLPS